MKRASLLNFEYNDFKFNILRQCDGSFSFIVTLFGKCTQYNNVSLNDAYSVIEDCID